ncbi:MAG: MBL fold metallo-hydrolase [Blastocatellia bacterium]|nr:MBL fold metallo-hydrolase [Blastocatellia bacterium]
MASLKKRVPENVAGDFFVDATCIDCDTCRQIAPTVFDDAGNYSFVHHQPQTEDELRTATQALLACPTGSIGTTGVNLSKSVIRDFPQELENGVFYCGFNSPKSYGGHSYFIRHPQGNWLVDSPRFLPHLVKRFEEMGGLRFIFLTHRDDVAEAESYAEKFGAERIIHRHELSAQPNAEQVLEGTEPVQLAPDFLVIPTPGHTRGHLVLLYQNWFLFTGDHLWWSRHRNGLSFSTEYCWHSVSEQKKSLAKLQDYRFSWVLPGHGERKYLPESKMSAHLQVLIQSHQV